MHVVVAGCPPDPRRTVLVLPWMLLAIYGLQWLSTQRSALSRAAVSQAVVHLALALTSPCAPHAATAQGSHTGAVPAVEAAMAAAHLAALVACLTVLGRTERALARAAVAAAAGCLAFARRGLTPAVTCLRPEQRRPPVPDAEGLRAPLRTSPRCGYTRGPPAAARRVAMP